MRGLEYEDAEEVRIPLSLIWELCPREDWFWAVTAVVFAIGLLSFEQKREFLAAADQEWDSYTPERRVSETWTRSADDPPRKVVPA
jgi:hypothetical protein